MGLPSPKVQAPFCIFNKFHQQLVYLLRGHSVTTDNHDFIFETTCVALLSFSKSTCGTGAGSTLVRFRPGMDGRASWEQGNSFHHLAAPYPALW